MKDISPFKNPDKFIEDLCSKLNKRESIVLYRLCKYLLEGRQLHPDATIQDIPIKELTNALLRTGFKLKSKLYKEENK